MKIVRHCRERKVVASFAELNNAYSFIWRLYIVRRVVIFRCVTCNIMFSLVLKRADEKVHQEEVHGMAVENINLNC